MYTGSIPVPASTLPKLIYNIGTANCGELGGTNREEVTKKITSAAIQAANAALHWTMDMPISKTSIGIEKLFK